MILPSPLGWISAKQSPPMPVDCGSITPSSAQAATAASAAVPPERSTSIAVSAASGCDVATMRVLRMDRRAAGEMEIPHVKWLTLGALAVPAGGPISGGIRGWPFLAHSGGAGQCLAGE